MVKICSPIYFAHFQPVKQQTEQAHSDNQQIIMIYKKIYFLF